jgi:DNA-binding NarL/FixJ family response regulator
VRVVIAEVHAPPSNIADLTRRHDLTKMQASVLGSLARGLSDREISKERGISLATVRTHVGQVLSKLGVRSRMQAALLATGHETSIAGPDEGQP